MMAYRTTEHEATGLSPNTLMLGRETTTPLDLMYCMPTVLRPCPVNVWVWELWERLEEAHAFVRRYSDHEMVRQKTYHDQRTSWERFEMGDTVNVYFPQKKKGCTPKFTSLWRGPFHIIRKVSNVLYEVDCGRDNQLQIVHCDRIKKTRGQALRGEPDSEVQGVERVETLETTEEVETGLMPIEEVDELAEEPSRPRRNVNPPARLCYVNI